MKAIILGNSFSLHDFPYEPQKNTIVFGVNRIFLSDIYKNEIDYYCALDPYLWQNSSQQILSCNSKNYYIHKHYYNRIQDTKLKALTTPLNIVSSDLFGNKDTGYGHGYSSIYPCIQLACE